MEVRENRVRQLWVKGGHGIAALGTPLVPQIAAEVVAPQRASGVCQLLTHAVQQMLR
jgi:hypothetical protein